MSDCVNWRRGMADEPEVKQIRRAKDTKAPILTRRFQGQDKLLPVERSG